MHIELYVAAITAHCTADHVAVCNAQSIWMHCHMAALQHPLSSVTAAIMVMVNSHDSHMEMHCIANCNPMHCHISALAWQHSVTASTLLLPMQCNGSASHFAPLQSGPLPSIEQHHHVLTRRVGVGDYIKASDNANVNHLLHMMEEATMRLSLFLIVIKID